ncbi:MAG: type I glyceraldehyde-3-phosphate dehydrogenase [Bacilli bacterium]
MIKVAINGFGRIGRLVFRIMEEDPAFEVVAINDLTEPEQLAYLLKYDTNHRSYKVNDISYDDENIIIDNRKVKVFNQTDPSKLPWEKLQIDEVFECTGHFTDKEKANSHLIAGAKKVVISAPGKGEMKTVVYNVNENILTRDDQIISAASCTTNCLAPVVQILDDNFNIIKGYMTTIHAYTNDQTILDVAHKKGIKARRGRAGAMNIVPSSTGAAKAVGLVLPNLKGKLDGSALRVPTSTGSVVDLTIEFGQKVTVQQINEAIKENTNETIGFTVDPIVSSDIIGSSYGALVDGLLTSVLEVDGRQLIKVVAWYDNEMGYSYQMVRTAKYLYEINS